MVVDLVSGNHESEDTHVTTSGVLCADGKFAAGKCVLSVAYSSSGSYMAAACSDGNTLIMTRSKVMHTIPSTVTGAAKSAATSVSFRPDQPDGAVERATNNVVMTTLGNGHVVHIHASTGQVLHDILEDAPNQVLVGKYRHCGTVFATGGSDTMVRVYNDKSKTVINRLGTRNTSSIRGHTSRVFSVEFHPTDSNLLLSGGWDLNVFVWDLSQSQPIRNFFGPKVCGQTLSIPLDQPDLVLVGSWEPKKVLQLWNHVEETNVTKDLWSIERHEKDCFVYSSTFLKGDSSIIVAGGSESNELRVLERTSKSHHPGRYQIVGGVKGLSASVMSVAYDPSTDSIAVATGSGIETYTIQDVVPDNATVSDEIPTSPDIPEPIGVEAF